MQTLRYVRWLWEGRPPTALHYTSGLVGSLPACPHISLGTFPPERVDEKERLECRCKIEMMGSIYCVVFVSLRALHLQGNIRLRIASIADWQHSI